MDHDPRDGVLLHGHAGDQGATTESVELELAADETDNALPTRVHAIVLVSKLHKPTLRALAFAKASRPNSLEGVYVSIDNADTARLLEEWDQRITGVPLKILHSPYREVVKPIVEYAIAIRGANPRAVVAVYIPEYVVGRWWEQLLHNQTALRLKGRLLFTPGGHGHVRALPAPIVGGCARARGARGGPRLPGRPAPGSGQGPGPGPAGPVSRPRRPRVRQQRGQSHVGERYEAEVGPVAHGGHCVVRLPLAEGDRVVFVRHALPGERVVVEITEGTEGDRFWRGDAVEVITADPDRVAAPCPYAGPGLCGGCDFQHVSLSRQRDLKAGVVREQLRRLAGLEVDVVVEAVPGDRDGLGWRTRQRYVPLPDGRQGMRKHRSHDVVPVERCLLEAAEGPRYEVRDASFAVAAGGFWQVHPGAPEALVEAVLEALAPQPGESALDLYAGVGLFSRFLLDAVGGEGRVCAVEGDAAAVRLARRNCPGLRATAGEVGAVLATEYDAPFDLVVLDPPRVGAKRKVVEQVVDRRPRAVAYVACDPAALARDVAIFAEHGYRLASLRAFDLFPMTHHVECVALLERPGEQEG